jgi:hypothetical protein
MQELFLGRLFVDNWLGKRNAHEHTMKKQDESSLGDKVRSAEKHLTKGIIKWRLRRLGLPTPDEETLEKGSERIVDEAHRVMKDRGKGIVEELKQAKEEFVKAYRGEGDKK